MSFIWSKCMLCNTSHTWSSVFSGCLLEANSCTYCLLEGQGFFKTWLRSHFFIYSSVRRLFILGIPVPSWCTSPSASRSHSALWLTGRSACCFISFSQNPLAAPCFLLLLPISPLNQCAPHLPSPLFVSSQLVEPLLGALWISCWFY